MEKMPFSAYLSFLEFRNDPNNNCLRYGQAFIVWAKKCKDISITDDKLFYCDNAHECVNMIFDKYVNIDDSCPIKDDETISKVTLTIVLKIKHLKSLNVNDIANELEWDFKSTIDGSEVVSQDMQEIDL